MKTVEEKAKEYCRPTIAYYKFNRRNNFDEIEILLKESYIAGYTEANKWISVEDELPKIGQLVLIQVDNDITMVSTARYKGNGDFIVDYADFSYERITHWRPIN